MKITVNGQYKDISNGATIQDVIAQFCPSQDRVVAEVNESIIEKTAWSQTELKEGDVIELVTFVGGG